MMRCERFVLAVRLILRRIPKFVTAVSDVSDYSYDIL